MSTSPRTHRFTAPLASAALALLIACGGDGGTNPSASLAGIYSLATVNGKSLPITMADSGGLKIELVAPTTLSLGEDQRFYFVASIRVTGDGPVFTATDTVAAGHYTASGKALTFVESDGTAVVGEWDGAGTVTLGAPPEVMVFRK
jgi:hypothetical protein